MGKRSEGPPAIKPTLYVYQRSEGHPAPPVRLKCNDGSLQSLPHTLSSPPAGREPLNPKLNNFVPSGSCVPEFLSARSLEYLCETPFGFPYFGETLFIAIKALVIRARSLVSRTVRDPGSEEE